MLVKLLKFIYNYIDMKKYTFTVTEKHNEKIIKEFLKSFGISDRLLFKVKFGGILLNGENAFLTHKVKTNDLVEIVMPKDEPNEYIEPLFVPLDIIYEDEYFIAVYKQSGMLTHNSRHESYSLENALAGYFYPNPFVFRGVNRLDRDTSGIVIVAKDSLVANILAEQIKNGGFKKEYLAIVCNTPPSSHGFINAPIKRKSADHILREVAPDGKESLTEYYLEKTLDNNLSLVRFILHTGRTHQIRVHSAYIGCPLYADKLYGKEIPNENYTLSAFKLTLTHPFTNKTLILEKK